MGKSAGSYAKKKELQKVASLYDTHDFWHSQPVPQADEAIDVDLFDKPIDVKKTVNDIPAEPLPIPAGFTWCNVNIADDEEAKEVYTLLT